MTQTTKSLRGFTIVELLVVIAIIGILAAVTLVTLSSIRAKARDVRRITDLREIANALHLYNTDSSQFPNALSDLVAGGHIPAIPTDPQNGSDYGYVSLVCTPASQAFVLKANLERAHDALGSDIDGTRCGLNCGDGDNSYCIDQ